MPACYPNSLQGSEQFAAVFLVEVRRVIDVENVAPLYNVFIFTNFILHNFIQKYINKKQLHLLSK